MGRKLSNAPVYYTVAQVQFNPILNLDGYLPAIQTKMRETRFPDFKQEVVQRLVIPFASDPSQMAAPTITPQSRYFFGDIDGRSVFLLDSNSLSFQTTAYDTYEVFSATLLKGIEILHESIRLDFFERVGLRYLDAVLPLKESEELQQYLVPEVLGHAFKMEGQLQQSVSETITMTSAGQLVSRVIIRNGQVGLPMELTNLAPAIAPHFTQHIGLHAIIDTDAYYVHREVFDVANVGVRLSSLHDEITKAFKVTVTPHAYEMWA